MIKIRGMIQGRRTHQILIRKDTADGRKEKMESISIETDIPAVKIKEMIIKTLSTQKDS